MLSVIYIKKYVYLQIFSQIKNHDYFILQIFFLNILSPQKPR